MRFALAALLAAHGVAHVVGFLGAWAPTRTTIFGDRVDLGRSWIKLVGIGWLLGALAFGTAAIAAVAGAAWWPSFALTVASASLVLCILQLPETKFGLVLNIGIIALLLLL